MFQRSVAFFDLDYTLYRGKQHHVILDFPYFLFSNNLFLKNVLDKMNDEFNNYLAKRVDRKTFADNVLTLYYEGIKGQSVENIETASLKWLLTSTDLWYSYTYELVGLMRIAGVKTIVISGSPIEPLNLIKNGLGVDKLFATTGKINKNGFFIGEWENEFANAEAKRKLLQSFDFDPELSFAFGDSESDYPLLEAVNPNNSFLFRDLDDAIASAAVARGWHVQKRSLDVIEDVKDRLRSFVGSN